MKARELIRLLEDHEPEATVRLMCQSNWPFEYGIAGVVSREDCLRQERVERESHGEDAGDAVPAIGTENRATDVFIVEGSQLGYGMKAAWGAACR